MRAELPVDRLARDDTQQARWLLAAILDWHRREAKPQWSDHFRLVEASLEELVRDGSTLGDLTFLEDRGASKKSRVHRYRFDPARETRIREGKSVIAPAPGEDGWAQWTVDVTELDPLAGTIDLKRNPANPHPVTLIRASRTAASRCARRWAALPTT